MRLEGCCPITRPSWPPSTPATVLGTVAAIPSFVLSRANGWRLTNSAIAAIRATRSSCPQRIPVTTTMADLWLGDHVILGHRWLAGNPVPTERPALRGRSQCARRGCVPVHGPAGSARGHRPQSDGSGPERVATAGHSGRLQFRLHTPAPDQPGKARRTSLPPWRSCRRQARPWSPAWPAAAPRTAGYRR